VQNELEMKNTMITAAPIMLVATSALAALQLDGI
jgi:hypothetical protein